MSKGIKADLTVEDIKVAIRLGRKYKNSIDNILLPYTFINLDEGPEIGRIITKFFFLATRSSILARQHRRLSAAEIERALKKDLAILISTYGSKRDFLRACSVVLEQGGKTIEPVDIQAHIQTTPTVGFRGVPYYTGYVVGYFPYTAIDLKAKTTIILIKERGECRFIVDFSLLR